MFLSFSKALCTRSLAPNKLILHLYSYCTVQLQATCIIENYWYLYNSGTTAHLVKRKTNQFPSKFWTLYVSSRLMWKNWLKLNCWRCSNTSTKLSQVLSLVRFPKHSLQIHQHKPKILPNQKFQNPILKPPLSTEDSPWCHIRSAEKNKITDSGHNSHRTVKVYEIIKQTLKLHGEFQ